MRFSQDRLVLAATVIAESAWLFAAVGVASVAFGQDQSVVSWPALLTVSGVSTVLGRAGRLKYSSKDLTLLARLMVGAGLIYMVVATQVASDVAVDLWWVARLFTGSVAEGFAFSAVVGSAIGAVVWWRGGVLAAAEFPTESLAFSPNPPKDTDGRREESGRGGEGATGEIAWVPFGVGRSADGLHRRTGAPMAVCGSCDAGDGERIRSRELSRTGLARVCGDLRLSGGWVADGAVRPGVEWLAAGPRRG